MATNDNVSVDRLKKNCKYCKKNTNSGLVCVKCASVYHKACANRTKTCCDEPIKEKYLSDSCMTEEVYSTEENALLRQIIFDKGTIIEDKEMLISLLNDKIVSLEEKLQRYENKNKIIPNTQPMTNPTKNPDTYNEEANNRKNGSLIKTGSTKKPLSITVSKPAQKNEDVQDTLKSPGISNKQGGSVIIPKEVENVILEIQTRHKCNEIINLETSIQSGTEIASPSILNTLHNENESNWHTVRGKNSYKRNIGQSENVGNFKGAKPKVWMYIYRVDKEVEEEDIKIFMTEKTMENKDNITVKYLKTSNNLKTFMIAADFKFKEDLYKPSFWPRGVGYRRFDFRRDMPENNIRPSSFLDSHKLHQATVA